MYSGGLAMFFYGRVPWHKIRILKLLGDVPSEIQFEL